MKEGTSSAKGFMILSFAGIFAKILAVFNTPLLNRIIGVQGMGMYSRSYDVFMFVYAITSMGCQPAVAKVVAEFMARDNEKGAEKTLKISRLVYGIIGLTLMILLVVLAYPIAKIGKITNSTYAIMFLAPSVFFTSVLSAYRGYFQGKNEMTGIAISQIIEQILNVFISLLCAYILSKISLQMGAAGGTIGTSVGAIIAILYLFYFYNKKKEEENFLNGAKEKREVTTKVILRKLFRYGFPITLSAGIQNLGGLVDMMNVGRRLIHAGFTSIQSDALYGSLYNYKTLIGVPLIIVTALTTIVLPAVSKAYALRDRETIINNINFSIRVALILTIPAAVGLTVLHKDVYAILFKGDNHSYITFYGSFILVFTAIAQLQSVILQGISRFYSMIISFTIGIILKIIANYIFVGITSINILGVLIGNFLCFFVPVVINNKIIYKSINYKISLVKMSIKPIIASVIMGGVIILFKQPIKILEKIFIGYNFEFILVYTIILVLIGSLIYVYFMVAIGGIKKSDLSFIPNKFYKLIPNFIIKKLK
ncbi:polysaccharide biosynthesis protein [Clostridium sp. Ade.TY]|uniref:putative polysaccharide biosynthesis protein n=1 Tax=Clostridium sp. Ade.TY TaxID=1391647 RepID=UPI0003F831A3|nr:polysaccharide biosynthesis protein [Clostridium sp. Ade.TY]